MHSIHRLRISKGRKPSSEFDCPLVECRLCVGPLRERIHVAIHPVFGGPRGTGIDIGGVLESDFSVSALRDDLPRGAIAKLNLHAGLAKIRRRAGRPAGRRTGADLGDEAVWHRGTH